MAFNLNTPQHFFSVERTGYTTIAAAFVDIYADLTANGFIPITNGVSLGIPVTGKLKAWKATVVTSSTGHTVGRKLYVTDGTRPLYNGVSRPAPYFVVTEVNSAGNVIRMSDLYCDYYYPVWTVEPTGTIELSTTATTATPSGVQCTLSKDASPSRFAFALEAGPLIDPLNDGTLAPADRQPWLVSFEVIEDQKAKGSAATSLQMKYDEALGQVKVSTITDDTGTVIDNVGSIGAAQPGGIFSSENLNQGFYNRKLRVGPNPETFPLTYLISITNRGFFLGIWEGTWSTTRAATTSNSNYFNWVMIQRPVDRNTGRILGFTQDENGTILPYGKSPVFHVNGVNYKYYKSVVRESDILHPTSGPAPLPGSGNIILVSNIGGNISANTVTNKGPWNLTGVTDSDAVEPIFTKELSVGSTIYEANGNLIGLVSNVISSNTIQISTKPFRTTPAGNIGIDWTYSPPGLAAFRVLADAHSPDNHAIFNSNQQVALTEDKTYLLSFPHNLTTPRFRYTEELDMIGTTSADVVMSGQDIQFQTYGEWGPRSYRALPPSGALNTGLRLAVMWAPAGPKWIDNSSGGNGDLGYVIDGQPVTFGVQAQPDGIAYKLDPVYTLARGSLPKGLEVTSGGQIQGTVATMDYSEPTVIKFTLRAKNAEDLGYADKDFFYTYVPGQTYGGGGGGGGTPTRAVTGAPDPIEQGNALTITLTTTNVSNGTSVPYTITGVTSADISGASLTGNFTVNTNTDFALFNITADPTVGPSKTLTLTLDGTSETVSVTITYTGI